jgi:ketosteroid isomerase-like protein
MYDDVLQVNQSFYDAHEQRDLEAMRAVWEHSDRTVCTHPGWPILRTWPVIEESWRRIFAGGGRNQFIVTNIVASGDSGFVWVTLDENLMEGAATGTVAATNVFARFDDVWRLVVHHGSAVMTNG